MLHSPLMANCADPVQKPTDLDLHCLQRQDISWFSRTKVKLTRQAEGQLYPPLQNDNGAASKFKAQTGGLQL